MECPIVLLNVPLSGMVNLGNAFGFIGCSISLKCFSFLTLNWTLRGVFLFYCNILFSIVYVIQLNFPFFIDWLNLCLFLVTTPRARGIYSDMSSVLFVC